MRFLLVFSGLALLPAMRVGADDPRPLQIDGIAGLQTGGNVVVRVRVLQPELIPMTQVPGDIRRIRRGSCLIVLRILQPFVQEPDSPLPVKSIGEIRIKAEGADGAVGEGAV